MLSARAGLEAEEGGVGSGGELGGESDRIGNGGVGAEEPVGGGRGGGEKLIAAVVARGPGDGDGVAGTGRGGEGGVVGRVFGVGAGEPFLPVGVAVVVGVHGFLVVVENCLHALVGDEDAVRVMGDVADEAKALEAEDVGAVEMLGRTSSS